MITGYDKVDSALTDLLTDLFQKHPDSDPGLGVVISAWGELPEAVKAGIVAMVQASLPRASENGQSPVPVAGEHRGEAPYKNGEER